MIRAKLRKQNLPIHCKEKTGPDGLQQIDWFIGLSKLYNVDLEKMVSYNLTC